MYVSDADFVFVFRLPLCATTERLQWAAGVGLTARLHRDEESKGKEILLKPFTENNLC